MTTPLEVRNALVDLLRRDLIGPHPERDADLAKEVLNDERPSRWYVAGFIVPAYDGLAAPKTDDEEEVAERKEDDLIASETLDSPVTGDADEKDSADQPPRDRFLPSSIGLTVVLPEAVPEVGLRVTWGDYKTVPPLPDALVIPDVQEPGGPKPEKPKTLHWVRSPGGGEQRPLDVTKNSGDIPLPGSAGRTGGALVMRVHQRTLTQTTPSGEKERLRVVTVFLVNKRKRARAPYTDVAYAFQARIELSCPTGFHPRADLSTYQSSDDDLRLADLHYSDVYDYGVGRNTSAGWDETPCAPVTRVWTDPMPQQEVERVAPNEEITGVEFGMQALASLAQHSASALVSALRGLPQQYAIWRAAQERLLDGLAPRRREVAERLIANQDAARARIERGIALLESNDMARQAFAIMNEAMATAARRRESIAQRKPLDDVRPPAWRPFQLAFVLLNLVGLTDKESPEREIVDLLFFPTGGGKTEAYLGLAAHAIALRRLRGSGVLGAGVSVIMRYTLRLLTLDQLSRAAGLVCALELMRTRDTEGRTRLGEWPIEIGLWVGGAASPNRLKPLNANDTNGATRWLARYQSRPNGEKSPVPLKACPWCGTRFKPESFYFTPSKAAPQNLCIKCENAECDFTRDRPLPIVVVDEPIYRRLPAFIIATVDKFASLPWVGQSGAFFGHVDRFDPDVGFYGAAEPGRGLPLVNGHRLDAPDLIIQDELHLISGPLGTVAGLYEAAIDLLASRQVGERRIRTKIVASTATVRRAQRQIQALFDREETAVFPPPGIDRRNSFFARTVESSEEPARRYLGIASQGRGPKLLFLRTLQALLSGAAALGQSPTPSEPDPADPYMTVLTYFNALRELGGARRIVEDEIRQHVAAYGENRVRIEPPGQPFKNRDVRMPLELTSRVTTDDVALAKERLGGAVLSEGGATYTESVDVALATNMISVGLDIPRLGLMVVQGQPKTAAEYIQATSRVGRERDKPGLVVTLLNLHKPRDRTHYEQFRAFHASFYRAVEPTSVTPFAPRALDRALAAVVVAAARHVSPNLSASDAVVRLQDHPEVREKVMAVFAQRAASAGLADDAVDGVVGRTSELLRAWVEVAEEQTATGSGFTYDGPGGAQSRLLQRPLDPASSTLPDAQRQFEAGRSMRDVEHGVLLKAADPYGQPLKQG